MRCIYMYLHLPSMYILISTYFTQGFVANRERVITLCPPLQWRMGMGAVPVQKMVNFSMQGQTLQKWRRPSASLDSLECRSDLVAMNCIRCWANYLCMWLTLGRNAAQKERIVRGPETSQHGKADWAWWEMKCGCEQSTCQYVQHLYTVYTCMYLYIPC